MSEAESTSRSQAKLLVVDDEPAITVALAKRLRRDGYECVTAGSGDEALKRLATDVLDLVITDVRMPGMSGIELLKEIKRRDAEIQVIMMTAYSDIDFAIEALRHKADDYLLKPFNLTELSHCVERALEHRRLLRESRASQAAIGEVGREGLATVERHYRQGVAALAGAIESRDQYTAGHLERVARYALAAGAELGLAAEKRQKLWLGAVLHDVGMVAVPEAVINKPGPLTPEEWGLVREHPLVGSRIVQGVPYLEPARPCILQHHERWNGSGYPAGLKGDEISLEGCVLAVADAFAVMLSERPYRKALSEGDALDEVKRSAGYQFERRVVRAFLAAHDKGFPVEGLELEIPDLSGQAGDGSQRGIP